MALNMEIDTSGLRALLARTVGRPLVLLLTGGALILLGAWMLFGGSGGMRDSEQALEQAQRAVAHASETVDSLRRLLQDEQVQALAAGAAEETQVREDLLAYLRGRLRSVQEVRLFTKADVMRDAAELGSSGYIIQDMLLVSLKEGLAPAQLLKEGETAHLAVAGRIGEPEQMQGLLMILAAPDDLLGGFDFTLPAAGYIALEQSAGGLTPSVLREYGSGPQEDFQLARLVVPGSLFRVVVPQAMTVSTTSPLQRLLVFVLGALLLGLGFWRRQLSLRPDVEFHADPESFPPPSRVLAGAADRTGESPGMAKPQPAPSAPEPEPAAVGEELIPLEDLHYTLEKRQFHSRHESAPVELTAGIFRAYDIRGVVGKTLDAGVARKVGQAVGSLAMERKAGPVVVARDGRHSGPDLVDGMIDGLNAAGCDVIDVGAVPTGALYYAAWELGGGSGVMVTGSHNPPDYNGFKVMLAGETLSGDAITALYERIASGNLRTGKGQVRGVDILDRYRARIAGDIQLKRPLRVVADCGNGIGGICAGSILSAIGAEVLPLFDDVDGNFPNHHPDPSEPENLEDLIATVKLMDADVGVAFDGDADRLGVVTATGQIVYPDRVMMLFAREVLSRNPGATIIYDVKCTGHLHKVIEAAGGVAQMWKTGHSLIKSRMREIGSPFAGEMSGHFFFKDRWYGFDCGIYSAARLLEILAADGRSPEEVFRDLPNSVSTPELKVQMEEGENHAFIEKFQKAAQFPGARVSTIDGVRADFEDGWGLVRASNTTPILVLRFDADSVAALKRVQEVFRAQILALRPGLKLPF